MNPEKSNAEKFRGFLIWFFYVVIVGGGLIYHIILFPVKSGIPGN